MRLHPALDRRRKLTEHEKQTIKRKHATGLPIREIHRQFPHVSRRLIQFVLFPERMAASNQPGKWKRYYDKAKRAETMRNHRAYKRSLRDQQTL